MPSEFSNPRYITPGGGGGAYAVLLVANAAARLALLQANAAGRLIVQGDDGSEWSLVPGGLPSIPGDWVRTGVKEPGTMAKQDAAAVAITGGSILGVMLGAVTFSNASTFRVSLGLGNVNNTSDADKPVSTAQQNALNSKADLESPTFTGEPKGPTSSEGDNSDALATTAYVDRGLSGKAAANHGHEMNAVNGLLDALSSLGSDLEATAPIQNPAFEGSPTAPTPEANDASAKLATTAFVAAAIEAIETPAAIESPLSFEAQALTSGQKSQARSNLAASVAPMFRTASQGPPANDGLRPDFTLNFTGYTQIRGMAHSGSDSYVFYGLDSSGNRVWTKATDTGFTSRHRIWWDNGYWWLSKRSIQDIADGNETAPPGIWRAPGSAARDPETLIFVPYSNCAGNVGMSGVAGGAGGGTPPDALWQLCFVGDAPGPFARYYNISVSPVVWLAEADNYELAGSAATLFDNLSRMIFRYIPAAISTLDGEADLPPISMSGSGLFAAYNGFLTRIYVASPKGVDELFYHDADDIPIYFNAVPDCGRFDLSGSGITAMENLDDNAALFYLDVSNTALTEIPSLASCAMLETINLSGTPITAIPSLANCPSIRQIDINDCPNLTSARIDAFYNAIETVIVPANTGGHINTGGTTAKPTAASSLARAALTSSPRLWTIITT